MKRKPPDSPPPARGGAVRTAFEDALRRMAGQIPFEKLTVRGISRAAGYSTRTFYNRWKSKYDLVIRYYAEEDLAAIRAGLAGGPLPTYENLLRRAIRRLRRDRRMFLWAFRDMTGPESFAATFLAHACRSTPVYIRMRTGRDMPSGLAPVLRHYYGGMLLVIAEWLASPAPVPPERILRNLLAALSPPSAPSSSLPPVHPPPDTLIEHSFLNLVPPSHGTRGKLAWDPQSGSSPPGCGREVDGARRGGFDKGDWA